MHYDIFNGDADGIFALHQYRLKTPLPPTKLITGVKRDTCLLAQLNNICNSTLNVFDISLDSNRSSLLRLLKNNNKITFFDHHSNCDPIQHPGLQAHIDIHPDICTSLIVNRVFHGQYGLWAICGAFGDNLHKPAIELAHSFHLNEHQIGLLRQLGELFNYNSYGLVLDDLLFHPQELYKAVKPFTDPFEYLQDSRHIDALQTAYQTDLALAMAQNEMRTSGKNRVFHLPDAPWARRITGVYSNIKAREQPGLAHAILTDNIDGTLRVSVRAPLTHQVNADTLCKLYLSGGGRAGAAGINSLPKNLLAEFLNKFQSFYPHR